MKQFLVVFILFPLYSLGQNLEISVSDIETNEPLPFANIYFKKSGIGASSPMDGRAYFRQSDILNKDSIVVSYIGYDKQVLFFSKENTNGFIAIELTPSSQTLSEVVVKYQTTKA